MISITPKESDRPIIKRMKSSLLKKFNPNNEGNVDNAVMLANYLVAIGELNESKALLESFLYFSYADKPEKYEHLWLANSQGLILLSYIYDLQGNESRKQEIVKSVLSSDYHELVNETHFQKLLYDYRNNEWYMGYYKEESHKYRCEILGQECLTFLYWKQTWEFILSNEAQKFNDELEKIERIINTGYSVLKEEILVGK